MRANSNRRQTKKSAFDFDNWEEEVKELEQQIERELRLLHAVSDSPAHELTQRFDVFGSNTASPHIPPTHNLLMVNQFTEHQKSAKPSNEHHQSLVPQHQKRPKGPKPIHQPRGKR